MAEDSANPLWLGWMQEMLEDARLKNLKSATTLKKACDSLKSCPLPMTHPSEALALNGFGPKTCERLEKRLKEHCEENGLPMPKRKSRKRLSENPEEVALDMTPAKKPRKAAKAYVPQLRSGPYAILLALASIGDNECVSKQQLIEMAQPHCDASFIAPKDTTSFHTAWSSMKTLVNKDLVKERKGAQKRYELTDDGWDVAEKIKRVGKGDEEPVGVGPGEHEPTSAPVKKSKRKEKSVEVTAGQQERKNAASRFKIPPVLLVADDLGLPLGKETINQRLALMDRTDMNMPNQSISSGQQLGGAVNNKYGTLDSSKASKGDDKAPKISSTIPRPNNSNTNSESDSQLAARLQAVEHDSTRAARYEVEFLELLSSSPQVAAPPVRPRDTTVRPNTNRVSKPRESIPPPETSLHPEPLSSRPAPSIFTPPDFQPIALSPSTFTIELILDNREIRSREDRTYIETELLQKYSIRPQIRSLPLGDFFWVAKLKDPNFLSRYGEEGDLVALDYIIERKRLDDLISSIKDGRFREQKFRLRRSGAKNVVYLIEEIGISQETKTKYWAAMQTAIASTQVIDGFTVKRTKGLDESIRYLARMTRLLKSIYEASFFHSHLHCRQPQISPSNANDTHSQSKPLTLVPSSVLSSKTYSPLLTHLRATQPTRSYNITYNSFAALASKSDNRTLRDVFLHMLMTIKSLTGDKAIAIQAVWPTPRAFVAAFSRCKDQKDRDGMVEKALEREGVVGREKVGRALSKAVAEVWGAECER
ncbi:MAG: hypothetical protein Q9184_000738 [Pyrenodesmia sp. 2 TL-2023]